jgi:diguanylate cyclase (GGDEF)-like protein
MQATNFQHMELQHHSQGGFFQEILEENRRLKEENKMLKERNAQLEIEVVTDPMTEVYNNRYLKGKKDSFCVMIDVDNFKKVNDTQGHDVGNLVLIELANQLKNNTRQGDVVRVGGDEFLILLENATDITKVESTVKRLRKKIPFVRVTNPETNQLITVGISVGYAETFKGADTAMYENKKERKRKEQERRNLFLVKESKQTPYLTIMQQPNLPVNLVQ